MPEIFSRGMIQEYDPPNTAVIAEQLGVTLGTNGERVDLTPDMRAVNTAVEAEDKIVQDVRADYPGLNDLNLGPKIDKEVAGFLRDSHHPGVPPVYKVEAATVGVVNEIKRHGGEVAEELAKDPDAFTQAVGIGLRGGLDPTGLEQVVKAVTAREKKSADEYKNTATELLQSSGESNLAGEHESLEERIARIKKRDVARERRAGTGTAELWREDLFGTAELEGYQKDVMMRLEMPSEQRVGEAIVDGIDGRERRPIMNIELDEDSRESVKRSLDLRTQGMDTVTEILRGYVAAGKTIDQAAIKELLCEHNVWPRSFGNVDGVGARGTAADLYIDNIDLQRYRQIDILASQLIKEGHPKIDSVQNIQSRFISLASTMFPAGAEFIHVVNSSAVRMIKESQTLATRDMIKYGAFTKTNLNGGFIHMTASPNVAYEYGDKMAFFSTVIGVPIETVMRRSPYLMLEDSYTDNAHGDNINPKATQEKMGGFTLKEPYGDGTPVIFRDRFATLCDATKKGHGFTMARIGQGNYDNYGFAASSNPETASRYVYPLSECRVYNMWEKGTVEQGDLVHDLRLVDPNPVEINSTAVQVFAPVEQIEVSFRESTLSDTTRFRDERTLPLTLQNVATLKVPEYGARLLFMSDEDPAAVQKVLKEALSQYPERTAQALIHGFYDDYITAVCREPTVNPQERIDTVVSHFSALLDLIPDKVLMPGEIRLMNGHDELGIRRAVGIKYAERMRRLIASGANVNPNWIRGLYWLEDMTSTIATDDERRLQDEYNTEQARLREQSRREAGPVVFPNV